MRYILLLLLSAALFGADTDPFGETKPAPKLPNSAQALLTKADADIAKLREKAHDDELARRAALVRELEKIQLDYTKKGDLDTALLIKNKIEEQRTIAEAAEPKPVKVATKPKVDAPVTPPKADAEGTDPKLGQFASNIVGKWKASTASGWSATWIFTATGVTSTEGAGVSGTYKVIKNKLNVIWANGVTDVIDTVTNDAVATGVSGHGSQITISRL